MGIITAVNQRRVRHSAGQNDAEMTPIGGSGIPCTPSNSAEKASTKSEEYTPHITGIRESGKSNV